MVANWKERKRRVSNDREIDGEEILSLASFFSWRCGERIEYACIYTGGGPS